MKWLTNSKQPKIASPVMTYASYNIDENGNISCTSGSTYNPDGIIAKVYTKKKAEENKAAKEKAEGYNKMNCYIKILKPAHI